MQASSQETQGNREIRHSHTLSEVDPVEAWGWGTAAGKRRANRRAALVARKAHLGEGKQVLELGCGTGMFSETWAGMGVCLTALDISPELIAQARERHLRPDRVTFVPGDFGTMEFGRTYDAIIGSSVLHHLDWPTALAKAFRLLAPGGWLCFAEPNMLNPQVFLERTFRSWKCFWYVSPDETAFVRWPLQKELQRAGFREIEIQPFDWLHPSVPEGGIPLVQRIGRCLERTPLLREFAGSLIISAQRP